MIKSRWYGINKDYLLYLKKRLEISNKALFKDYKSSQFLAINYEFTKVLPNKKSVKEKNLFNIILLDFIMTYKGWRHIKGLPVNGQRTWSNANSTYKNNTVLREYKSQLLKYSFKNIQQNNINTIYLAEQVNLLWKNQWEEEWKEAKKRRLLVQKNSKNFLKIDLVGLASGNINFYSKKKKTDFKKNVINLGFDPGFTKNLFKNNILNSKANIKSSVIVDNSSSKIKKKKTLKTVVKQAIKIKKKKSSWD